MINTHMKGLPDPFAPPKPKVVQQEGLLDWIFGKDDVALSGPELPEPLSFQLKPGGTVLHGHLASDPKHAQYPSARFETRTFIPTATGEVATVDFRDVLKDAAPAIPSKRYTVSGAQIKQAVQDTAKVRQQQMKSGQLIQGQQVVPKDGSLNPDNFAIFLNSASDVSYRYCEQLSQIGKIEGFHLIAGGRDVDSMAKKLGKSGYDNISFLTAQGGEAWVEDYGEPTLAGGRVCPAIFDDPSDRWVADWIAQGREERYKGTGLDGHFSFHGAVNAGKFQPYCLAQGVAEKGQIRQALSYLEGGNIMPGTKADGQGFVLIGADSFHVSRRLLEKQTGKKWSVEDTKKAIAADLGLKPENVHSIEQPGAFHLDMRLTPVGPGHFLLNDSVAAAKQQIEWGGLSESRANAIMEHAKLMGRYEDLTAKDLQAAGFTVDRAGGVFVDPADAGRDTCNFFNARHGTNDQGERFTILMGSTPQREAYFVPKLIEASHGQISRVHILDPKVSQTTLDMWGGLKCRTKPEGDLVSQELLNAPHQAQLTQA